MNQAQVKKYLSAIRASYWFIPSIMVSGAIILSLVTIYFDKRITRDWAEDISFLFSSQPEGARAFLSTVAGSMITVAGVTFSLTLLAVSHSTGQFGPRVLNNFMRDRGNQFTLGTFISTYIYCLLILRTVRSAEEPPVGSSASDVAENLAIAFVPQISITVALVMTLCSVAVLIYFIHHIPESIRLSNVVSGIGKQLKLSIQELFPEMIASGHTDVESSPLASDLPKDFYENSKSISCSPSGYIQALDEDGLMKIANEMDLVLFISRRPGDFHCEGNELLRAWPSSKLDDDLEARLTSVFAMGVHRTYAQNVMFSVDQLVEIAQRALSPGVNDPMTAMYCLDWLQAALVEMAHRDTPRVLRYSKDGKLRVFAKTVSFEDFCSRIFDQLRQYVALDRNAAIHMISAINHVRDSTESDSQRATLDHHADLLIEAVENSSPMASDFDDLKKLNEIGVQGIPGSRLAFDSTLKTMTRRYPDE